MKKRIALIVVLALVTLITSYKYWKQPAVNADSLRHLNTGDVVGYADKNDTFAWLGIPFAQPPLGDLRWRAPQPPTAWDGVRKALNFSAMCPQLAPFSLGDKTPLVGAEDCLYLNVWTPRLAQSQLEQTKLPVMVWIHGGANTLGTGNATAGYKLAGTQNVIVVTLQYRLGLLGWMSHPALRNAAISPADASSNFGLLDMIAALQWVKNNIGAFGGDPNNVTIFGESAGAFDVYALMAAPPAKGLFHRAIAQSGALRTTPQAQAENYSDDTEPGKENSSREFINKLLVADGRAQDRAGAKALQQTMDHAQLLTYMRSKTIDQLFKFVIKQPGSGYSTPSNIRDSYLLPDKPLMQVFADPTQYNNVPVMLGSNRDEYKFFLWSNTQFIDMRFGFVPKIKDIDEYNRINRYFSDQWQMVGVDEPAAILQRNQPGKVFTYRLDWADQPSVGDINFHDLFGSAHSNDLAFVFGDEAIKRLPFMARAKNPTTQIELSAAIMRYWATFAKTGAPGNGGNPAQPIWQPWQEHGQKKIIFDVPDQGGIRMSDEVVHAADLKERVRNDSKIQTPRAHCELYAQLFFHAMSSDFWSDDEYGALGCANYPVSEFKSLL